MRQQIDRSALARIVQAEDIERLSFPDLVKLFQEEAGTVRFLPDGVCQVDPRNGDRILFNSSRARRPHDNRPELSTTPSSAQTCAVCQGNTTGVIDVAELSEGFTFINKNLYPALYPLSPLTSNKSGASGGPRGLFAYGLHFLQWTSSLHDKDWHNMPLADRVIVMQRLATLERKLLMGAKEFMPVTELQEDQADHPGSVLIIKNYGHLVGGSLAHGHQQIALSNIMPKRLRDDLNFVKEHGETFSCYLLRENPTDLLVRDYGPAVLVVPYFMRRPYDMMLLVKDVSKRYLYELTGGEIAAVAEGWHDAIQVIRAIMPKIGREIAYNVVTHNGPGNGLYFEFLPYVQETGGFEHLGLLICQGNPSSTAGRIREQLVVKETRFL